MDGLDDVIAGRLRNFLEGGKIRREEFAAGMTRLGFRWTANRVTQVVTQRRPMSLLEITAVCSLLGVPLKDLMGQEGEVELPSGSVRIAHLWPSLCGDQRWAMEVAQEAGLRGGVEGWVHNEAAVKVGRRLGIRPDLVDLFARDLWGLTLAEERDRRVGPPADGESGRALQARRGHVTRQLVEDLRSHMRDGADRLMEGQRDGEDRP